MRANSVTIYTDGSCHGNPGPGGYAAIVLQNGVTKEVHGSDWYTTNNRMELTAVIEGLKLLSSPSNVTIITDSKYVANQINKGNLQGFLSDPSRKNADLWEKVMRLSKWHKLSAEWVRGHSGNKLNQRCDSIANREATLLEKEREIRRLTFSELLTDITTTPECIAQKHNMQKQLPIIKKYYSQFFEKQASIGGA